MVDQPHFEDEKALSVWSALAVEAMKKAAEGFSGMIGQQLSITQPEVKMLPFTEIPNALGGPEAEAAGIYLRCDGDIPAQFMLILPYEKAFEICDMLFERPIGETEQLGSLERSALAEVGNLTGTFFMNSIAATTGLKLLPTPPAVMVDMVGAILDIIVATTGGVSDSVLVLKTAFQFNDREVKADFWVIPDQKTLKKVVANF